MAALITESTHSTPVASTSSVNLNEMNKSFKDLPWNLSFSYGRALQQPTLVLWQGKDQNIEDSQEALYKRSKLNSIATTGEYSRELE